MNLSLLVKGQLSRSAPKVSKEIHTHNKERSCSLPIIVFSKELLTHLDKRNKRQSQKCETGTVYCIVGMSLDLLFECVV